MLKHEIFEVPGGSGLVFKIWEIPNMKAFSMIEEIRFAIDFESLKVDMNNLSSDSPKAQDKAITDGLMSLVKVILQLDPKFVLWLRNELFEHVEFKNKNTTWQTLYRAEETAFDRSQEGVSPMTIYAVLVRSFKLNFTDCYRELMSYVGQKKDSLTAAPATQP